MREDSEAQKPALLADRTMAQIKSLDHLRLFSASN